MKGRVIVLDRLSGGVAAALMVDGRLEDLRIDPPEGSGLVNTDDICAVQVTRTLPRGGAFCAMAGGADGFIREAKGLKPGQYVLAQVVSLPEPGKAVTLTQRILLKGPRLILTPDRPGVNVSRKIGNETERDRLKGAVLAAWESLPVGDMAEAGVIIRTSAKGADEASLGRELAQLCAAWRDRAADPEPGGLSIGTEGSALAWAMREWALPAPDALVCTRALADDLTSAGAALAGIAPRPTVEKAPFEAMGVHEAMRPLAHPEGALGPASMIVEATRALVAVDVNTGADFSPAAGLKANLAVARDLPRQLRLRGLGGKIAVDFAPMPKKDRRTLEEALARAFRADPVETALVGWTALGLYEMQRKRERRPLPEVWTP